MDIGDQLPWLREVNDDSGRPLDWRDTRRNRVVLFTHAGGCTACSDYARDLLAVRTTCRAGKATFGSSVTSLPTSVRLPTSPA